MKKPDFKITYGEGRPIKGIYFDLSRLKDLCTLIDVKAGPDKLVVTGLTKDMVEVEYKVNLNRAMDTGIITVDTKEK